MDATTRVTLRDVLDVYFRMEVEEGLFSMSLQDGSHPWDVVRRDVYLCLHSALGGPFVPSSGSPSPTLRSRGKDLLKPLINALSRRYLIGRAPHYLFITGQRLKMGDRLRDNIPDHLFDLLASDAAAIELMNKSAIRYSRLLAGRTTRLPPVAIQW